MIPRRIIAGSLHSPTLGIDVVETKWIDHGTWRECIGYTVHVSGRGNWITYKLEYRSYQDYTSARTCLCDLELGWRK